MTSVLGYTNRTQLQMQMLSNMRWQIDDLQRQLATGKRADTYAGLGIGRTTDIEARMRMSRIGAYSDSIYQVDLRVKIMNTSLERMRAIGRDTRSDVSFPIEYELIGNNQTAAQQLAAMRLDEAVSLMNERAGERFLFGGASTDTKPVSTASHILNGDGARAGLKQLIQERLPADQGADGRGRLVQPAFAGPVMTVAEDGNHPFGLKIQDAVTDFGGAITLTAGPPASLDIDLTAATPVEGSRVQVRFGLPDGSSINVELTATNTYPAPAGQFTIGSNATETAEFLAMGLDAAIQRAGRVELPAASAMQTGEEFFNIGNGVVPQRIPGPHPNYTAVATVNATAADTVFWYQGEDAGNDPRQTATARIDETITVSYGARANEDGMRHVVMTAAVFASMSFTPNDADGRDRYFALAQRVATELDDQRGLKRIEAVQTDLAGAQLSANAAKERLTEKKAALQGVIDEIENVMPEEVGVMLLAMTTRLQATLQTTAMLSQFNLLNYI